MAGVRQPPESNISRTDALEPSLGVSPPARGQRSLLDLQRPLIDLIRHYFPSDHVCSNSHLVLAGMFPPSCRCAPSDSAQSRQVLERSFRNAMDDPTYLAGVQRKRLDLSTLYSVAPSRMSRMVHNCLQLFTGGLARTFIVNLRGRGDFICKLGTWCPRTTVY